MQSQFYIFFIFILNGLLIGIAFDFFRILRKSFKTPDIITYVEDIIFLFLMGLLLIYSTLKFNNGEIRIYIFLGLITGLIFYLLVFSKIFIEISVYIISLFKKLINNMVIKPTKIVYKWIRKIFFKPIIFVCVNTKNNLPKIKKKLHYFNKKYETKKDFR